MTFSWLKRWRRESDDSAPVQPASLPVTRAWKTPDPNHRQSLAASVPAAPDTDRRGWCPGLGVSAVGQHPQLEALVMERLALPPALEADFRQTLVQVSRWFHCLPAHPLHHNEPGGALRHSLETTLSLLEFSQSHCFENDSAPDRRRQQAPLWRLSVALLGLLYDSGRLATCLSVNDPWAGDWPALEQGLEDWLRQHGVLDYQPHWAGAREDPREPLSRDHCYRNLTLMHALVPKPVLQSLGAVPTLWPSFTDALLAHSDSKLAKTVEEARQFSIKDHYSRGAGLPQLIQPHHPGTVSAPAKEAVPVQIGTMTGGHLTIHLHASPQVDPPVVTADPTTRSQAETSETTKKTAGAEETDKATEQTIRVEKTGEVTKETTAAEEANKTPEETDKTPPPDHDSAQPPPPHPPVEATVMTTDSLSAREPSAQPSVREKPSTSPAPEAHTSKPAPSQPPFRKTASDWQALTDWLGTLDPATLTLSAGVWQVPGDAVPPEHQTAWQRRGWLQPGGRSPDRLCLGKKPGRWLNKNVYPETPNEKG